MRTKRRAASAGELLVAVCILGVLVVVHGVVVLRVFGKSRTILHRRGSLMVRGAKSRWEGCSGFRNSSCRVSNVCLKNGILHVSFPDDFDYFGELRTNFTFRMGTNKHSYTILHSPRGIKGNFEFKEERPAILFRSPFKNYLFNILTILDIFEASMDLQLLHSTESVMFALKTPSHRSYVEELVPVALGGKSELRKLTKHLDLEGVCFKHAILHSSERSMWFLEEVDKLRKSFSIDAATVGVFHKFRSQLLAAVNQTFGEGLEGISGVADDKFRQGKSVVIIRRNGRRRILNIGEVAKVFVDKGFSVVELECEKFSVIEQIRLMLRTDILGMSWDDVILALTINCDIVGVHGAGLANAIWLKKQAIILELFPLNFRKQTYELIANITGIRYRSWSNSHPENSFNTAFNKEYHEGTRSYLRNQDTIVDIHEIASLIDQIAREARRPATT